jgi:hypothetical protein
VVDVPTYTVIEPWDMGRCKVRVCGWDVDVRHIYLPARAKPYFAARIRDQEPCAPAAKFTTLLRQLERLLSHE